MSHDVSVLVAGTFLRYFTSACEHLIAPMTLQGHSVDYYATLTTGQARRWRPTTLDVTYDPRFGPTLAGAAPGGLASGAAAGASRRPNSESEHIEHIEARQRNEHIEATVRRCVEAANGTLRCCLC